jgi:hypothetical protein
MDSQTQWEKIYKETAADAASWYRPQLEKSLALIEKAAPSCSASIIDVGGGESTVVDDLNARGRFIMAVSGGCLQIALLPEACGQNREPKAGRGHQRSNTAGRQSHEYRRGCESGERCRTRRVVYQHHPYTFD